VCPNSNTAPLYYQVSVEKEPYFGTASFAKEPTLFQRESLLILSQELPSCPQEGFLLAKIKDSIQELVRVIARFVVTREALNPGLFCGK